MDPILLSALAEPNRLRIVELLREGPQSVSEITERLSLHQPQASKHLRVLSEAGIVEVRPVAQRRVYQLQPGPFEGLNSWLESFRRTWEEKYDRLDELLEEMQASEKKPGKKKPRA